MDRGGPGEQRPGVGAAQVVGCGEAGFVPQPDVRDLGGDLGEEFLGDQRCERGGGRADVRREAREGVVGGVVGAGGGCLCAGPVVVPDHGGAVVDEPRLAAQAQQVGVAPGAVDVVDQRVEPDDPSGLRRAHLEGERVEAERAGEEAHAQVGAAAGLEQFLHLLVGLTEPEHRVDVDGHQPRHPETQPAGEFAADHLGDQRLAALTRAGELQDVRAEVVGLDESRQRTALTQRRDVAGREDLSQHLCRPPVSSDLPVPAGRLPRTWSEHSDRG